MQNTCQRSKVPAHVLAVFDEKGAAFELVLSNPKKSLSKPETKVDDLH